jgi:phosphatidylglycerol---prolipoprotein diacylglyceryl transferase
MFPILQIGPIALQISGLLLLLGAYLGLSLTEQYAIHHRMKADPQNNLFFLVAASGLIGARISFAIQNFDLFRKTPLSLFSLDPSLLDPWGGLAAGLIAALVYGQRRKLEFWSTLDAYTPGFAVFTIALGLSHFASGNAFGAPTSLPWAIDLWGTHRHPTQIYESIAAAIILFVIWRQFDKNLPAGNLFLRFIAMTAGARLFLEAFRGDSVLVFGNIRLAQVLAWIILASALIILEIKKERSYKSEIAP